MRHVSIQVILVGVDFSDASRRALDTAVEIAKGTGARLELVFAQEVLTYRGLRYEEVLSPDARKREREEAEQSLRQWHAEARGAGVEARERVVDGDPRRALLKVAGEIGADLLVLGAKARSRPGELFAGSIAHEVSHEARCSVLLAR